MKALYGRQAALNNVKKLVRRECVIQYDEIRKEIVKDIAEQLTAAALYTLNVCEGFGEKRLRRFFEELNGTFQDMAGVGFAGEFDADDLTALVRERFGIDLAAEITCVNCVPKKKP